MMPLNTPTPLSPPPFQGVGVQGDRRFLPSVGCPTFFKAGVMPKDGPEPWETARHGSEHRRQFA